jgi:hypothetical protein
VPAATGGVAAGNTEGREWRGTGSSTSKVGPLSLVTSGLFCAVARVLAPLSLRGTVTSACTGLYIRLVPCYCYTYTCYLLYFLCYKAPPTSDAVYSFAVLRYAMLCCAGLLSTTFRQGGWLADFAHTLMLCSETMLLRCAVLCCAVLCCAALCCAVLCSVHNLQARRLAGRLCRVGSQGRRDTPVCCQHRLCRFRGSSRVPDHGSSGQYNSRQQYSRSSTAAGRYSRRRRQQQPCGGWLGGWGNHRAGSRG